MKPVSLFAPINHLGYGVVSFNVFKELINQIDDVTLYPINDRIDVTSFNMQASDIAMHCYWNKVNINRNSTCIKIFHENMLYARIGSGKYIGYPFFELDAFDRHTLNSLRQVDHLFVPSNWAKTVLAKYDINNTSVVPCGVDKSIFNHQEYFKPSLKKCIFFNCGKWEYRKGHDVLIKMFRAAFDDKKDVQLMVMPTNPFISDELTKEWTNQYNYDNVQIISKVDTQKQLANLMSLAYCGIFPARSEGWNLELLEMMAMGRHTIATNYAGHTEYINNDNCFPIPINSLEIADDGVFFTKKKGQWAKIDSNAFDYAVNALRTVYDKWKSNPTELNHAGIATSEKFSWANTVKEMLNYV